jgi:hypothetical protein
MGVVFAAPERKTVYVAGDTIWCAGVDDAIEKHNAIISGWEEHPNIMRNEDTLRATLAAPEAMDEILKI